MAPGAQSNSNIALMRSCGGAGRDLLTNVGLNPPHRSSGWARTGFDWTRPRRTISNVCGPFREIEPLTRSSRGSLPRKGPHAWSDRFPHWSLQPRAAGCFPPGVLAQERSVTALGRPLHPHHQEPGRAHAVQRRDPKQAAQFRVTPRRDGASPGHDHVAQGAINLTTQSRIPSASTAGTICDTAPQVMGKNKRNVP